MSNYELSPELRATIDQAIDADPAQTLFILTQMAEQRAFQNAAQLSAQRVDEFRETTREQNLAKVSEMMYADHGQRWNNALRCHQSGVGERPEPDG
jgi:hypothetical protein